MKCPSCGSENDNQARFCAICGRVLNGPAPAMREVTKICPFCGRIMNANAIICPSCGQSAALSPVHQMAYAHHGGAVVTQGRKYIAFGLIVTGLYFLWWGMYSVYNGVHWGWEFWGGADYMDMIFSFIAGTLVLMAGITSLMNR